MNQTARAPGGAAEPNSTANTETVRGFYAAFARGDIPAILSHLSPDAVWALNGPETVPYGGTVHGREAVGDWFRRLGAAADYRLEIEEVLASGHYVVAFGQAAARAMDTGRPFSTRWAHIWTFREGRVARFEAFVDSAAVDAAHRREA